MRWIPADPQPWPAIRSTTRNSGSTTSSRVREKPSSALPSGALPSGALPSKAAGLRLAADGEFAAGDYRLRLNRPPVAIGHRADQRRQVPARMLPGLRPYETRPQPPQQLGPCPYDVSSLYPGSSSHPPRVRHIPRGQTAIGGCRTRETRSKAPHRSLAVGHAYWPDFQ